MPAQGHEDGAVTLASRDAAQLCLRPMFTSIPDERSTPARSTAPAHHASAMKTLTIASHKGGVGKTTVALNLSYALANRGWRTLLVDVDPQGAIGLSLARSRAKTSGLSEVLSGAAALDGVIMRTRLPQFGILAVGNVPIVQTSSFGDQLADGERLRGLLARLAPRYDIAVIDTPAGFGTATLGALRAADFCMSPLQCEPIALRAAPQMLEVMGELRGNGARVRFAGFVLTMLQVHDAHSMAVAEAAWNQLPDASVMQSMVPRDPAFLSASAAGVPLGLLSRTPPPVASLFDQLAAEVEQRITLTPQRDDDGPVSLFN